MFSTQLNNKLYISPTSRANYYEKKNIQIDLKHKLSPPQSTPRKSLDEINKLNNEALLSHIDSRLKQEGKKISTNELKELSQAFIKRSADNEIEYIKKINKSLIKLEKINSQLSPDIEYGYILRYLLKKMLDAEYQEEFILYFRSFNNIAANFEKKENMAFSKHFWEALVGIIDTRFVFLDSKKETENQSYKNFGKIFATGLGSMPIVHPVFSGISWWRAGIGMAAEKIHESPFARPPLPLKTRITNYIANHAKQLIIGSIILAAVCIAAPLVAPLIIPVITPIAVSIATDIITIASLTSTGITAAVLWNKERQKTNRINKRLDKVAVTISQFEEGTKPTPQKKTNLAFIIQQLYASNKPGKKKKEPSIPPTIELKTEKPVTSESFAYPSFSPPMPTPYLPSSNPLLEEEMDEQEWKYSRPRSW